MARKSVRKIQAMSNRIAKQSRMSTYLRQARKGSADRNYVAGMMRNQRLFQKRLKG